MSTREITPLDAYLLLVAIGHFRGSGRKTFVQKAMFCAEEEAARRGESCFPTFPFYRYTNGPYSKEIAETEKFLARHRLIKAEGGPLTDRGRQLVTELEGEVRAYPEADRGFCLVTTYASRFSRMPLAPQVSNILPPLLAGSLCAG